MEENDKENKVSKENKENKRDFKTSNNEVTVKGKNKMLWETFLTGKNIMFICF